MSVDNMRVVFGGLQRTSTTSRRDEDELIEAAREDLLLRARTDLKQARMEKLPE